MKKKLLASAIAVFLTSNVFATDIAVSPNTAELNHTDMQTAFLQDNQPLQLASLSKQEMVETEGAVLPALVLAVVGPSALSAWGYHAASYLSTGQIGTSGGAATAATLGAFSSIGFGAGLGVASGVTGTVPRLVLGVQGSAVNASLQSANNSYQSWATMNLLRARCASTATINMLIQYGCM